MTETPIYRFADEYRWLSNFWPAQVEFEGRTYPSVEHAYQAAKTFDPQDRAFIAAAATPGAAKRLGKKITLRSDWESNKIDIMTNLVRYKFTHHLELWNKLLATGNRPLYEGNHWGDRFWGVVPSGEGGIGQNHLGKIIMRVREELRQ